MSQPNSDNDLSIFRAEARAWFEANFPASLRGAEAPNLSARFKPEGDALAWKQRVADKGWGVPTWPTQYGGGGLPANKARIVQEEMARVGAYNPVMRGLGVTMIGPTLLDYGTDDQKQRHLPLIARGEVQWCLGYSEPNAGSDLASLMTKGEDAGDHWRINGSKIWTSWAHCSDWIGVLARTDPKAKKHEGISFLLVDMSQPGVEVRPILMISGRSQFCETFLTDARAAKNDLLGQLNRGWDVGKRLLQHERASQTGDNVVAARATASRSGRADGELEPPTGPLTELAGDYLDGEAGSEADLHGRLIQHAMDVKAQGLTNARARAEAKAGPTTTASVLKNVNAGVLQARHELTIEMMGGQGLGWEGEAFSAEERSAMRILLDRKASSISGGSFEIQYNIIAKRILGLPEKTQSS